MLNLKRLLFLSIFFIFASSLPSRAYEHIQSFHSDITVNQDGSLTISETITVRHEGRYIRKGISRGLSTTKGERYEITSVLRNGNPEPWFTQKTNKQLVLNTGDDTPLPSPAVSTFVLTYNMYDALRPISGENLNELYLNVTGQWDFKTYNLTIDVHFPEKTTLARQWQYTRSSKTELSPTGQFNIPLLNIDDEATIAIAFSKGTVNISLPQKLTHLLYAFLATLIYYLLIWYLFGKDPTPRPIVPSWETPEHISPLECALINNNGIEPENGLFLSAIWFAQKKLLTIVENVPNQSYTFQKNKDISPSLLSNREIITALNLVDCTTVDGTPSDTVDKCNQALIKEAKNKLEKSYYFTRNNLLFIGALIIPLTGFAFPLIWGLLLLLAPISKKIKFASLIIYLQYFLPLIAENLSAFSITDIIGLIVYCAMFYLFRYLLFQPTYKGQRAKEQIEGLKMFLTAITKNGVSPTITKTKNGLSQEKRLTPEDMEELFPYAVALNLEKEWCKKFSTIFGAAKYSQIISSMDYYRPRYRNCLSKICCKSATPPTPSPSSSGRGSRGGGCAGGGFGGGRSGGR